MSFRIFTITLTAAALLLLPAAAQELRVHPTPFSVWLDFSALASLRPIKAALPIWMESVQSSFTPASPTAREKTTVRLRLRRMASLNGEIQLRLFFNDLPGVAPVITGWTETGLQIYTSPVIGAGLDMPNSESLTIPVADLDYLDIAVPGDGHNLRGAFLTTLRKHVGRHALDFEPASTLVDPFSNAPMAAPGQDDSFLLGRVKATIDAGTIKLSPTEAPRSHIEFELQSPPLLALISFDVLGIDPFHAPELTLNDRPMGRLALQMPDLADPGYHGRVRPLELDMRFQYMGWVRCQQVVAGSMLQSGINNLTIALGRESGPIAIRAVEVELKYPSPNLDYQLVP